ncbi:MAG: SCO1664 family protein [Chloroflexi bacterium]|nr:SCO1664 family protein [Chloroflexota bacterium]
MALRILGDADMAETHGLLPWSSNYTFLVELAYDGQRALAIYKPLKGERPLWDFPDGCLYQREMAAFLVSEALGWSVIPPTVIRSGPHGIGSVQLYVPHDPEQHYFTFGRRFPDRLKRISLLDHVINNADRKGGHCLLSYDDEVWAIDHGICFHHQDKLRTVIWDFANQPIPDAMMENLIDLCDELSNGALGNQLNDLITRREQMALRRRIDRLIETGMYPEPGPGRNYPWPPV